MLIRSFLFLCLALTFQSILGWDHTFGAEVGADNIFEQYKDRVVQIRILEAFSGAKSSVGSGFVVSPQGHIITNYHVISQLIHRPEQYRGEIIHQGNYSSPLMVLNFDAIHDLALVKSEKGPSSYFQFHTQPVRKGTRMYSLGNPWDLGKTIIEGTHSGLVKHTLYEKIHFTGSINPGMSGGPTVLSNGKVLGINVATAGNQLSFLVPAKFAKALLEQTVSGEPPGQESLMSKLRDQLLNHQDLYLMEVLSQVWETTTLGPYRVPGKIAPFIKCWGNSSRQNNQLFETVTQRCSFEDGIYLSGSQYSGTMLFTNTFISTEHLNRFRFYNLYQEFFQVAQGQIRTNEEEVGPFRCHTDFVAKKGPNLKVVFCARGYKKLPNLYDSYVMAATLDGNNRGLQTSVSLTGVSFENAKRFASKFLETISWNQ